QGVGALVVDDEAGVDAGRVGVGVAAEAVVRFEQRHVVRLGQHVARSDPAHAAADDGDPPASHGPSRPNRCRSAPVSSGWRNRCPAPISRSGRTYWLAWAISLAPSSPSSTRGPNPGTGSTAGRRSTPASVRV